MCRRLCVLCEHDVHLLHVRHWLPHQSPHFATLYTSHSSTSAASSTGAALLSLLSVLANVNRDSVCGGDHYTCTSDSCLSLMSADSYVVTCCVTVLLCWHHVVDSYMRLSLTCCCGVTRSYLKEMTLLWTLSRRQTSSAPSHMLSTCVCIYVIVLVSCGNSDATGVVADRQRY